MDFTIQGRPYTSSYMVEQFMTEYNSAVREERRLHCRWLPTKAEIPSEFFDNDSTTWGFLISSWAEKGLNDNQRAALTAKPRINKSFAIQFIQKHLDNITFEKAHKIAGCAYLASLIFETPR